MSSFNSMADKWPSTFVARESVSDFSGGILNSRTMANLDSKGIGPEGRLRIGRKIAYPVGSLVVWLEKRAQVLR